MQLNFSASALQIGEIISANLLHIQYAVKQNFQNQDAVNIATLHCMFDIYQGHTGPGHIICVPAPSDIFSFNRLS